MTNEMINVVFYGLWGLMIFASIFFVVNIFLQNKKQKEMKKKIKEKEKFIQKYKIEARKCLQNIREFNEKVENGKIIADNIKWGDENLNIKFLEIDDKILVIDETGVEDKKIEREGEQEKWVN